jgi:hypothetical protein
MHSVQSRRVQNAGPVYPSSRYLQPEYFMRAGAHGKMRGMAKIFSSGMCWWASLWVEGIYGVG